MPPIKAETKKNQYCRRTRYMRPKHGYATKYQAKKSRCPFNSTTKSLTEIQAWSKIFQTQISRCPQTQRLKNYDYYFCATYFPPFFYTVTAPKWGVVPNPRTPLNADLKAEITVEAVRRYVNMCSSPLHLQSSWSWFSVTSPCFLVISIHVVRWQIK